MIRSLLATAALVAFALPATAADKQVGTAKPQAAAMVADMDGTPVRIAPVRYEVQRKYGVQFHCALDITKDGETARLPIVGIGMTEAVSCDAIDEIGLVTIDGDPALAIVATASSPNASGRSIVIVREGDDEAMAVDEAMSGDLAMTDGVSSLVDFKARLAETKRGR